MDETAKTDNKTSWRKILQWKLIAAAVLFPTVWFISGEAGFPVIFQMMFMFYVVFGTSIFIFLDLPLPEKVSSGVGIAAFGVFFIGASVLFTVVAHLWPQINPETELAGINRKTDRFRKEAEEHEPLAKTARELSAKADQILAKLAELQASGGGVGLASIDLESSTTAKKPPPRDATGLNPIEHGMLVYKDHECYNCHKVGGKGGKKRGPELDNIANLVTAEQLKKKIYEPTYFMADGYEDRKKDKMPDNYQDLMSDDELNALVGYLMTLKDTNVKTPKPIFKDP